MQPEVLIQNLSAHLPMKIGTNFSAIVARRMASCRSPGLMGCSIRNCSPSCSSASATRSISSVRAFSAAALKSPLSGTCTRQKNSVSCLFATFSARVAMHLILQTCPRLQPERSARCLAAAYVECQQMEARFLLAQAVPVQSSRASASCHAASIGTHHVDPDQLL